MFFRHFFDGEFFTFTIEQGGMGVLNGYFLRGFSVNGTSSPLIFRRLMVFIS